MEPRAVLLARQTGLVQDFLHAGWIDRVLRDVRFGSPMIGRKDATGDAGFAVKQKANQYFAVGGEGEGLADFAFGENGIFEIEAEITKICARTLRNGEARLPRENGDHVRRKRTHLEVGGSFTKFERADDGVRNNAKTNAGDLRSAAKVVGVALDDDFFVLGLRDEAKRA